jgi:hypothetical protein
MWLRKMLATVLSLKWTGQHISVHDNQHNERNAYCGTVLFEVMTTMQASLTCKRVIMPRGSLDVDLTVDENLALKPSHHYLTKLCKNLLDVSIVGSTSNGP